METKNETLERAWVLKKIQSRRRELFYIIFVEFSVFIALFVGVISAPSFLGGIKLVGVFVIFTVTLAHCDDLRVIHRIVPVRSSLKAEHKRVYIDELMLLKSRIRFLLLVLAVFLAFCLLVNS